MTAAALALLAPAPAAILPPPEAAARSDAGPAAEAGELAPAPPDAASPDCLSRYAVGIPKVAAEEVARRETIICRRGYVVAFNVDTRVPDWVMEHLSSSDLAGPASRSDAFGHDPALPPGVDAGSPDYLRSGYDRGHQAPAGDAKFSQQTMNESFYFTNMAPQVGIGFNRGAWKYLEETVRGWVSCGGHRDVYVFTGPIYGQNPATIGASRVAIPRFFFKIVYDAGSNQAVGFVLPNVKIGGKIDLQPYAKPIADIEADSGLRFFPGLDERQRTLVEADAGIVWGHDEACVDDGD